MKESKTPEERSSESIISSSSFTTRFGLPEEWHHGDLPHRNKVNLVQSITFRLADSLPQDVLKGIEEELKTLPVSKKEIEKRKRNEKWLDRGLGCCALANSEMAQVVFDALQYYNGDRYNLLAWSIMPNHIHVLIETKSHLSRIVQSWKSYTGKWAFANNKKYSLGIKDGAKEFWRTEYWDRFMRDRAHFENTLKYILDNPKNANLPKSSTAYRFTGSVGSLTNSEK